MFYGTFGTNRLYHAIEVGNISHRAGDNTNIMQLNNEKNTINQHNHKLSSAWALWRRSLATVRLPQRGLSSQSLGKEWQLNQNNRKTQQISMKTNNTWKKRSEEMQTLCTGCSKVEPKIFTPPQTPFPGARDGQNLISWRWSLPLPSNPVWWGSMHTISS